MGDDMIDLPAMLEVGVPVAVPAAPEDVVEFAVYVTNAKGGQGAVREVTDLVLKSSRNYGIALTRLCDKAWHPTANISDNEANDEAGN